MKRSSVDTSAARFSVDRIIASKSRAGRLPAVVLPMATIWSGLMSIAQKTKGVRRKRRSNSAAMGAIGGDVDTSTTSGRFPKSVRSVARVVKTQPPSSRTAMEPFPNDDMPSRRTRTPSSVSRFGYASLESSYDRDAATAVTSCPRDASSTAASCMYCPTAGASGT